MDYIAQKSVSSEITLVPPATYSGECIAGLHPPWTLRFGKRTRLTVIGSPILQTFCRRNLSRYRTTNLANARGTTLVKAQAEVVRTHSLFDRLAG
jgi:hypothetical protein